MPKIGSRKARYYNNMHTSVDLLLDMNLPHSPVQGSGSNIDIFKETRKVEESEASVSHNSTLPISNVMHDCFFKKKKKNTLQIGENKYRIAGEVCQAS